MSDTKGNETSGKESPTSSFQITPPAITMPKGGGAIRGIGEKFAANPVTGSSTFSIPLPASPGRGGFGPQLALSYDSGSGNGPFGFGWSLALPSITRKTDKGLPRYGDHTDTFLISGAEDLVPVLNAAGQIVDDRTSVLDYVIRGYRPRIEGLFARIERWTRSDGDTHWRSISSDNVLSVYGKDDAHRIFDPADRSHIFSWLICETRDDKGNAILYDYRPEDGTDLNLTQAHEQQRGSANDPSRTANRYIDRIRYGNVKTLLDTNTLRRPRFLSQPLIDATHWMFELLFDYGRSTAANPDVAGEWTRRADPFSSYRAGFEVRTYRLCHRVLMFHQFPDLAGGAPCLVRSLDLSYRTIPQLSTSSNPGYSFLQAATQWSYQRDAADTWKRRQLPPVEFTYSEATINDQVRELDPQALENLPVGLGSGYQWIDLDGEGLSGILTEQAGTWYYKPNLGDDDSGPRFGPMWPVTPRPTIAVLNTGRQQLMDVQGNGALDLVDFHPPLAGFQERDDQEGWKQFVPFANLPNIDWDDRNLRFVDLTGDGHADALLTEHEVFTWYPSQAEKGFGAAERAATPLDERDGPCIVFADGEQAIYIADMSGDGLTDIVRIRNGQICYWPNLGYGRFGKQVVMDESPWFDHQDQFDQRRIRLADIDGSGTTDLFYLGREGARLWFNRSGNTWSAPRQLPFPVVTSNIGQIQIADLLGNGTACLVWSSDLPGDARRPLRYLDLMGGNKPHLMVKMRNNLGAETTVDYAASTKFYLRDKAAGTPWVTKLPFPVHCVEKVTVTDLRRKTEFANTYSYHHGYFDGVEREFRGFGRVEQVDTQRFDEVSAANSDSAFVTADHKLYQPPVKTITWFHTGIATDRFRILGLYEREYFPSRYADRLPAMGHAERELPQPEIETTVPALEADECREAMRACKGMALRQEVVELDVKALQDHGEHTPVRLFSAAQHNCHIRRVQPRGPNQHAVFLVTESEAVTYHYELALGGTDALAPDPRVAHTLNLRFDDYGRAVQSVAAVYPRHDEYANAPGDPAPLTPEQVELIRAVQLESHLAYTETRFTDELLPTDLGTHRLPAPCEVRTYELTRIKVPVGEHYFSIGALRAYQLDTELKVGLLAYHQQPQDQKPYKRLVEHLATLYFKDDLSGPLDLGQPSRLGLTYEAYKLALTASLLDVVFKSTAPQDNFVVEARAALGVPGARTGFLTSGYQTGSALFGTGAPVAPAWWLRSGVAGFATNTAQHFYLPDQYIDSFGNQTTLDFDVDDLFVRSSTDALGNKTSVEAFDHRVLAPARLKDANDNVSEATFDIRGLPVATALMGKVPTNGLPETGDTVASLSFDELNPSPGAVAQFFKTTPLNEVQARTWLGKATARFVYHFGERYMSGIASWAATAAGACSVVREKHEHDAANDHPELGLKGIPIQVAFEYSDGDGQAFVKKVQAEPDPAVNKGPGRWITNGKTIVNNKGKPVLKYEPYYAETDLGKPDHGFTEPKAVGVSPVMFYDAPGRLVRTEFPDGTLSRVEFSPWFSRGLDQSDTVKESRWYRVRLTALERSPNAVPATPQEEMDAQRASTEDKRAAQLAALHADTPAETHFDSLGREVIAIAHNRTPADGPALSNTALIDRSWVDERIFTFTKLDAEGKPLWICDARGNLVMQYITPPNPNHTPLYDQPNPDHKPAYDMPAKATACYDIAGNLLFQHSMDAGDRWMLNDAAGKPMFARDSREDMFMSSYDALHRHTKLELKNLDHPAWIVVGLTQYGEGTTGDQANNRRGKAFRNFDQSGVVTNQKFDLKGNALRVSRRLANDYDKDTDWTAVLQLPLDQEPSNLLMPETFTQITEYDALNRMARQYNWHRQGKPVAVYEPSYNARGLLAGEDLTVGASKTAAGHRGGNKTLAIQNVRYDAKGQRRSILYGNDVTTDYTYDPYIFRLLTLVSTRPNKPILQDLSYTYDPSGNITEIFDAAVPTEFFNNAIIGPRNSYIYDALYRLIEATGREHAGQLNHDPLDNWNDCPYRVDYGANNSKAWRNYIQRYTYDSIGNILVMQHIALGIGSSSNSWTRQYEYATDSNRLLSTGMGAAPANRYATSPTLDYRYPYNAHGSMTSLPHLPTMDWDYTEHLRHISRAPASRGTDPDGCPNSSLEAWYRYDAAKQRTRKRVRKQGGLVEERFYLGGLEWYRRTLNGTLVEEIETLHLFDGQQRLLMVDQVIETNRPELGKRNLYRYTLSNHLGSSMVEVGENADVISCEEYHPYGTTAYQSGRNAAEVKLKRYRYTGMERDEESGLSYHGARYYSPALSRWTSCDPSGVRDDGNLFAYVKGNPIVARDPGGCARELSFGPSSVTGQHPNSIAAANRLADQTGKSDNPGDADRSKLFAKVGNDLFEEAMAGAHKTRDEGATLANAAMGIMLAPLAVGAGVAAVIETGAVSATAAIARSLWLAGRFYAGGISVGLKQTYDALVRNGVSAQSILDAVRTAGSNPQLRGTLEEAANFVLSGDSPVDLYHVPAAAIEKGIATAASVKASVASTKSEVFGVLRKFVDEEVAMMKGMYAELTTKGGHTILEIGGANSATWFGNILNERVRNRVKAAVNEGTLTTQLRWTRQGQKGVDFWLPSSGGTTSTGFDIFTAKGSELIKHEKKILDKAAPFGATLVNELYPLFYSLKE